MSVGRPFIPTGGFTASVTTTSASTSLTGGGRNIEIANLGPAKVHFRLGASPTAVTTDPFILPGERLLRQTTGDSIAFITASGAATVSVETGSDGGEG